LPYHTIDDSNDAAKTTTMHLRTTMTPKTNDDDYNFFSPSSLPDTYDSASAMRTATLNQATPLKLIDDNNDSTTTTTTNLTMPILTDMPGNTMIGISPDIATLQERPPLMQPTADVVDNIDDKFLMPLPMMIMQKTVLQTAITTMTKKMRIGNTPETASTFHALSPSTQATANIADDAASTLTLDRVTLPHHTIDATDNATTSTMTKLRKPTTKMPMTDEDDDYNLFVPFISAETFDSKADTASTLMLDRVTPLHPTFDDNDDATTTAMTNMTMTMTPMTNYDNDEYDFVAPPVLPATSDSTVNNHASWMTRSPTANMPTTNHHQHNQQPTGSTILLLQFSRLSITWLMPSMTYQPA